MFTFYRLSIYIEPLLTFLPLALNDLQDLGLHLLVLAHCLPIHVLYIYPQLLRYSLKRINILD